MLVAGLSDVCHSLAHILKEAKTPILLTPSGHSKQSERPQTIGMRTGAKKTK